MTELLEGAFSKLNNEFMVTQLDEYCPKAGLKFLSAMRDPALTHKPIQRLQPFDRHIILFFITQFFVGLDNACTNS